MTTDRDDEVRKEILAISGAWAEAIVSNDADRIGSFMADDWLMISSMGVATKEHFLSYVSSGQLTHSAMDLAELASIKVYGDTAILAARVTNTAHFGEEAFDANEWTSDVFVKINGEWKCVMTHYTAVKEAEKV
jgi:ketosteroid isomerase-like protein